MTAGVGLGAPHHLVSQRRSWLALWLRVPAAPALTLAADTRFVSAIRKWGIEGHNTQFVHVPT